MGMAASQARFLGLTARKTNVEYEGQQINQQRTCLSNQSANYYNDMLGMSVPTPPSVDQFTKTVYSFNDGAITNQITALMADKNNPGMYTISYLSTWEDDFTPISAATSMVVHTNDNKYMVGATTLRRLADLEGFEGVQTPALPPAPPAPDTDTDVDTDIDTDSDIDTDIDSDTDTDIDNPLLLTPEEINKLKYAYINPITMENEAITKAQYESGTYNSSLTYAYLLDETKTGAEAITICYKNNDGDWVKEDGAAVNPQVVTNEEVEPATEETKESVVEEPTVLTPATEPVTMGATKVYNDPYLDSLSDDQIANLLKEEEYYIKLLEEKYGEGEWYVRYIKNTGTGQYQPYFYKASDLEGNDTIENDNGFIISQVDCYTIGSATTTNEIKGVSNVKVEKDATGRYIAISIPDADNNYVTYSLATSVVTDQDAYDDAMNQYEYDKAKYDQTIEEINAKIQIIQAQDKNLELRLKQLDTEQDAISTEMDAVQKVIEKNTESTFRTFG